MHAVSNVDNVSLLYFLPLEKIECFQEAHDRLVFLWASLVRFQLENPDQIVVNETLARVFDPLDDR